MAKHLHSGRPAKRPSDPRNLTLQVRLSAGDLDEIDRCRNDITRSGWVHRLIERALARRRKKTGA